MLGSLISGPQTYRFLEIELVIKSRIGFDCLHQGHIGVCRHEGSIQTCHCPMEKKAPRHRPCKTIVYKDQKGPYTSSQSSKWGSDVHKLSHHQCVGELDPYSDFLTPSPVYPLPNPPYLTPVKLQYSSLASDEDRQSTHTTTCSVSPLIRICDYSFFLVFSIFFLPSLTVSCLC